MAKSQTRAAQPHSSKDRSDGPCRNLILVLGDQLSPDISSLKNGDPTKDIVLMVEVYDEATYVRHHKKKIILVFSAMRHFADELRERGWHVDYRTLDMTGSGSSFTSEVEQACKRHDPERVVVTSPGEWRVLSSFRSWSKTLNLPVDILDDDRFVCSPQQFADWAAGRKQLRMEFFYREMRRKTGLLMKGNEPEGGQWNFDQENRKPAKGGFFMPEPLKVKPDNTTEAVIALVDKKFSDHFGNSSPFWFAVTRRDAEQALETFIETSLANFGDYQDAMLTSEPFLFHSLLSIYLNIGLLDPLAVCMRVDQAYRQGRIPLNSAEGYIRQIIGWREYVRGIYWLKMPGYVDENFFNHTKPVPEFYWTGETDMTCLAEAITQTQSEAYAHHIQRLMVTGNFALLTGVSPQALHEWYLIVYADAYEWVELPNTLGMSQFGDGGLLASKPYIASGAYINRMSDYCKGCRYDVKQATGPTACPLNALYWGFLNQHRTKLDTNPRMVQMYRTWDRMADDKRAAILDKARDTLSKKNL